MTILTPGFRRWILGLGAFLLTALLVLFLFREPLLRRLAESSIQKNTGMRAEIGELKSSLGSGAFEVRDLRLYNLKEFGGSILARIPHLLVDFDTQQAAHSVFHLRRLQLNLAELHVVRDQSGRLNLDGLEPAVREHLSKRFRRRHDQATDFQFGGIDQLLLTLRHVRYTDLKRPEHTREIDLKLEDELVTTLHTEDDLQAWLGAMIFRIVLQQFSHNPNQQSSHPASSP
ncbi:MAG TPA: hypothetical protein VNU68_15050 [Verrucomicrobiae bacterium]|jgi:hypothetical protein|nr:hypothetical protein [Verrucomicrobiae bacterium]